MTGFDEAMGLEVELECLEGQVRQSRQIVVVEASAKTHHLPIPQSLKDPETLRASYLKLGVAQPADARLICDPEERAWLEPLIKAAWPSASFGDWGLGAKNFNGAVVKLELTDRYFRAIAKIGFHYFLTQFPAYDGSEACFEDIRNFIISDGGGGLDRVNTFIGERKNPLLGPMMLGARPDGWRAHVLCAEIREEYLAHVQLFVCEDYRAPSILSASAPSASAQLSEQLPSPRRVTSMCILRKGREENSPVKPVRLLSATPRWSHLH